MTNRRGVIIIVRMVNRRFGGSGPIAERRRALHLSQEELAALCGISRIWIIAIEAGRSRNPQRKTLKLLARALKVSDEELSTLIADTVAFRNARRASRTIIKDQHART